MKNAARRQQGRSSLDLIEEAVHLLRTAPAAALAGYLTGTLPFLLGLLYFWADMSRSPFARQHVVEAALGVTLLFGWMKFWQALFARRLRAFVSGNPPAPLTFRQCLRILASQATLQPTGLFLLPLASIPVLPLAWVYAFYQNLTTLADADARNLRELVRHCTRQAQFWPQQNHLVLFWLSLFSGLVFLNACLGCGLLPQLLKTLFGVETVFSRSGLAMLNTTFFATMFALTYLCVDPILKAVYVLRCFYGDSIKSGADLRADLRHSALNLPSLAAVVLVLLSLTASPSARAGEMPQPPPAPTRQSVSPDDLNRAIDETIQHRKYSWRLPRERAVEEAAGKGFLQEFFERAGLMIRDALKGFGEWLGRILHWIFTKLFGRGGFATGSGGSGFSWAAFMEFLLYLLAAVVLSVMGYMLCRLWRDRHLKRDPIQTEALQPVPDLTDENVGADQLPEDGWTKLARELLARGEFRLALRAYYLSTLAHLAERNLISLARFKSNRDYERELTRRAHAFPTLRQCFGENVGAFDRVWYGTHAATDELVAQFAINVERIKAGG